MALFYTPRGLADDRGTLQRVFKWTSRDSSVEWLTAEGNVLGVMEMFASLRGEERPGEKWQLPVSRGFLYQLLRLIGVYQRSGKLYMPRLVYVLTRTHFPASSADQERVWGELKNSLLSFSTIKYLHLVLTWVDWLCREKEQPH